MFNFFKRKPKIVYKKELQNGFSAEAAKNTAKLSNQVLALKLIEKLPEYSNDTKGLIKQLALDGKSQARVLIINKIYKDELHKQFSNIDSEVDWYISLRVEDVGIVSSHIKKELEQLGYIVTLRELKIQVKRVQGDVASFFAGHDMTINW